MKLVVCNRETTPANRCDATDTLAQPVRHCPGASVSLRLERVVRKYNIAIRSAHADQDIIGSSRDFIRERLPFIIRNLLKALEGYALKRPLVHTFQGQLLDDRRLARRCGDRDEVGIVVAI